MLKEKNYAKIINNVINNLLYDSEEFMLLQIT
jgi:hypothetical protein